MDNERWNRVDKLLQSALDRPAADRERFLRSASGGDEQLEQDVRHGMRALGREVKSGAVTFELITATTAEVSDHLIRDGQALQ